jgi:hypothetical protein
MTNIERFNLYTAFIFGKLYEEFPVHQGLEATAIVTLLKLPAPEKLAKNHDAMGTEANLVAHSLMWLVDTGYLILRERGPNKSRKRYVLAPKAFEAMNAALPEALRQGQEEKTKSVGEKLTEVSREFGSELAKETRRQVASQLVGQVIGHAMRTISGP